MFRPALPLLLAVCALQACDQKSASVVSTETSSPYAEPASAPAPGDFVALDARSRGGVIATDEKQAQNNAGESYVYDHNLTLSMASHFVKARFDRARDKCQNDPALKCKVTNASFRVLGEPNAPLPVANLSVALPHDSVAVFEASLMESLGGENPDELFVKARQTSAQNVTNQVKDIQSRLSQLKNYRERMLELTKRGSPKTDDLIKIEGEISRTLNEIEQIEAQQRDLAERIAKENLTISFEAQSTITDAFQPLRDVWQSSARLLGESAASALSLVVALIPWIPLGAVVYFLLRWIWKRARRQKT